jgi:hypothetical protein
MTALTLLYQFIFYVGCCKLQMINNLIV